MISRYIQNFIKYIPLLCCLTSRDFKLKYRRSILGVVWSMLNPLLIMVVVTSVFSVILKVDSSDMPFAVFYITGSLIFNFFAEATTSSMTAVISNSSLIQKVYVPKYIFIFEKCAFSLLNMVLSSIAVICVMIFYIFTGEVKIHPTIFLIFIPMIFTFLFSVGIGLMLSTLTVFFRDMVHIWGVIITIWLYLTPVIYPIKMLHASNIDWIVRLNPVYYFVDDLRQFMVLGSFPGVDHFVFEGFSCGVVLLFGVVIFKKAQDRFILHI